MKISRSSAAIVFCAICLCYSRPSLAQRGGCNEPEFRAFDFWLGQWEVIDNVSGRIAGNNRIERGEDGCLLLESWEGASGSTGTSVNYYNPLQRQWRQLWVSAGRYAIDISGGLEQGSMRLVGTIYPFDGAAARFRGTWTANADGSVRQLFEQYDEESRRWSVWFDGHYRRRED